MHGCELCEDVCVGLNVCEDVCVGVNMCEDVCVGMNACENVLCGLCKCVSACVVETQESTECLLCHSTPYSSEVWPLLEH